MLTAIDGELLGGRKTDRFRIRIWRYDDTFKQDVVVYDNQLADDTVGTTGEGALLAGGSIVIHTK